MPLIQYKSRIFVNVAMIFSYFIPNLWTYLVEQLEKNIIYLMQSQAIMINQIEFRFHVYWL